jgi:opacity protein-like surface antigen
MKKLPLLFAVFIVVLVCASAQAQSQPPAASPTPDDISGMYTFLQDGEFVQITQEQDGGITGFVSRYGDLDSDKGAFLDQFFKQASRKGNQLEFTTASVHGVWYEFRGTVERGPGKTPQDEAYRVIKGKLTQHAEDASHKLSAKSREVTFKSFPADTNAAPPTRD